MSSSAAGTGSPGVLLGLLTILAVGWVVLELVDVQIPLPISRR